MNEILAEHLEQLQEQAIEMELSVIGCCLMGTRGKIGDIRRILDRKHFYRERNAVIYDSVCRLYDRNDHIDFLTIARDIENHGLLDFVGDCPSGGRTYLMGCIERTPAASKGPDYAKYIIQAWMNREIFRLGGEIRQSSFDGERPAEEKAAKWERDLRNLATSGNTKVIRTGTDALVSVFERATEAIDKPGLRGLPTGFGKLDKMTQGWRKGNLIVVGGRPSSGKSSFALQTAVSVAEKKNTVAFFSLEMGEEDISERLMAFLSGIDLYRVQSQRLLDDDWSLYTDSINKYNQDDFPLKMQYDKATVGDIHSVSSRIKRDYGLSLIVIDYLQFIYNNNPRPELRRLEVANNTKELKLIAKELEVPVIVLSQSSREVEKRDDKRPQLSDLAESGNIEYEADLVMFTEITHKDEGSNGSQQHEELKDAYLDVKKHRNGRVGRIPMQFVSSLSSFRVVEDRYGD